MNLTDLQKVNAFDSVFYEALGGRDVAAMVSEHYIEGIAIRAIAERHRVPETSVRRRIIKARCTMERVGLIPKGWKA